MQIARFNERVVDNFDSNDYMLGDVSQSLPVYSREDV